MAGRDAHLASDLPNRARRSDLTSQYRRGPRHGNPDPWSGGLRRAHPARTDILADEYKYLPMRRLALYIEESLHRGTRQALVFASFAASCRRSLIDRWGGCP